MTAQVLQTATKLQIASTSSRAVASVLKPNPWEFQKAIALPDIVATAMFDCKHAQYQVICTTWLQCTRLCKSSPNCKYISNRLFENSLILTRHHNTAKSVFPNFGITEHAAVWAVVAAPLLQEMLDAAWQLVAVVS